jgi:hypothetical protein
VSAGGSFPAPQRLKDGCASDEIWQQRKRPPKLVLDVTSDTVLTLCYRAIERPESLEEIQAAASPEQSAVISA